MDATAPLTAGLPSLLGAGDPPVYRTVNATGTAPVLLLCCHAGRAVPGALGDLGLDDELRARHIGWDIGAEPLTLRLAERLNAPAVLGTYSRLVVDPNRAPGASDSIPEVSDGVRVPANCNLSENDRVQRLHSVFWPYHTAVGETYAARCRKRADTVLVAIHTFTPRLNGGTLRPWEAGILWNRDERLSGPMVEHLRDRAGLTVGDNQPYSGREFGFSVDYHAGDAGRPHVAIEVRQDLLTTGEAADEWSALLADALDHAFRSAGLGETARG